MVLSHEMQHGVTQTKPNSKSVPLGLPFGVVMATAGASVLAGWCGLSILAAPLLVLAILQALWIPLAGAWRYRAEFNLRRRARQGWRGLWRLWAIGPAHEHTGIHTVPLGLAVIVSGLVALVANGAGLWIWAIAALCLILSWLLTILCAGRCIWSVITSGLELRNFDGAWFLVPAAFLGAAIATDAVAGQIIGYAAAPLKILALVGAMLGWLGYWVVGWAALVRVWRFGLGGAEQAPWWISMGCAGLAGAALGRAMQGFNSGLALQTFLTWAMVVTAIVAVILCAVVLWYSAIFLLCDCKFRGQAPWPPTFSTAVFALGCLEAGDILQSSAFGILGLGAAYATLLFWVATVGWNVGRGGIIRFYYRSGCRA